MTAGRATTIDATPTHRYFAVDGLRLHALDWVKREAPPLVLLHGFNGFAPTWNRIVPRLGGRHRVLATDLRGHGESDWDPDADYSIARHAKDLAGIVDQAEFDRFDLVGHSLGAMIALVYAARHPHRIRRLVLADAGPRRSAAVVRRQRDLGKTPMTFSSWQAAAEFARPEWRELAPGTLRHRLRHRLQERPDGSVTWRNDLAGLLRSRERGDPLAAEAQWEHLAALQCPTLVIRGAESDVLLPDVAEQMAASNPRIALCELVGAAHFVHLDQPDSFSEAIVGFLESNFSECPR